MKRKIRYGITGIFLIFYCVALFSQKSEKESLEFESIFTTGMKEGVSCYRIPAIITAPNGDLVAAIDERVPSCGDLRMSPDINIVIRRSKDNGESWSDIECVVDYQQGQSASDPSMIVDRKTGEIFLFFNFMDLVKEKEIYYLRVIKSNDNGQTWSEAEDITSQITKPEWHKDFQFITSGRGVQTRNGTMLHTLVNLERGLYVFRSDDHGKSWSLTDNPISPADESKIVELDDGSWMINSRVNGLGHRYVHISTDNGKSWESYADTSLLDPGCNASIVSYTSTRDGFARNRLLFVNARKSSGRSNLTVSISYDEGRTWPVSKTIYAGSAAYSSMTIMEDGNIGVFFEKDDYTDNAFVSFSLEWLSDGKDRYVPPKNPG